MVSCKHFRQNGEVFIRTFLLLLLNLAGNINQCSYLPHAIQDFESLNSSLDIRSSLSKLDILSIFDFENTHLVANDFGNRYNYYPIAMVSPNTVSEIASVIKHVNDLGPNSSITVTARGNGHSLHGQSQSNGGLIVTMRSLKEGEIMYVDYDSGEKPYIDVSGGELWINVLHESLKRGLAPKSWTDYLHLTVGGTLSNAGVSGQAFKHGPQIHNVYQLQVVTGNGDIVNCSAEQDADLFYGVLGGLGQFGIITKARIALEPAPQMVKWIRVLYSNFNLFTKDQEQLISSEHSFDYIEGFVIVNRTGLVESWSSTFSPKDPIQARKYSSEGKTLYCLEMALYFNPEDAKTMNKKTEYLLSRLSFIAHTIFHSEVSYVDFLNRVHLSERKLREKGMWDVPHPWLNLLVPKSKIYSFANEVFGRIVTDTNNGPILIYPVNQTRWNNSKTSWVTPEEDVIYLIAFLASATPSSTTGSDALDSIVAKNKRILDFCKNAELGVKQYLGLYDNQDEWRAHFGPRWDVFAQRKNKYDPLAILAPGQRIFQRSKATL